MRLLTAAIGLCSTCCHAGLLGVWSYDDCVNTYVVPAQVSASAGAATRACKGIYEHGHTGPAKDRDNCVLGHITEAKTAAATAELVRTCRSTNPVCKPNEAERTEGYESACEAKCKDGQVLVYQDPSNPDSVACLDK